MGLISLIVGGIMDANKAVKQNKAQKDDTVQNVVVNGKYSIDIPSFLSPTNKLSEDASLQYMNRTLDIAYQVIDEPKDEFVKSLAELKSEMKDLGNAEFLKEGSMLDNMAVICLNNIYDMDKIEIVDYRNTTINGLNAVMLDAFQKRSFFTDAIYGSFAFIEGRENMYQIIINTGGSSIPKLAEKLKSSMMSFREL